MADKLRADCLIATAAAGSGHPTSCLSCAEIMSCLFFSELKEDDEFILSKGHAAPILYSCLAEAGLISRKELENLRKITSPLEGHPTYRLPFIKIATGSLGQGLSAGVGIALAKKLENRNGRIYVLLGDGECAEGSIWEAANTANFYGLDNITAIVDVNRLGQSQPTMHGHNFDAYEKKFTAFGWEVIIANGHSIGAMLDAFEQAKSRKKPAVILAKTVKGKGVSFLENKDNWHGKALTKEELEKALREIDITDVKLKSNVKLKKTAYPIPNFKINKYEIGDEIATREAFGKALLNLGKSCKKIVALDGDVRNSTKTDLFFREFPERSFQSFIAEQNMVGMAAGLSSQGFIPFVSTFSAFLTRAYDFIRMARYSNANIKFVGSHSGVSIGEDGPSQMGLEDISMFLPIPDSVVVYPCDAVSAENLLKEVAKHKGISYLRTTRNKTPVIYGEKERFPIGKFKVLRKSSADRALVIAAGVTVHEALKAYEKLKKKAYDIRVIDMYSVKPFDSQALIKNARECRNKVIVVEDHYLNGIGSAVSEVLGKIKHLCIREVPRSGKSEELMKKYCIDANAIIKAARG